MTVYIDKAGTTNWVQVISNIDVSTIDFSKGYNLTYAFSNASTAAKIGSSQQIEVYNYDAFAPVNVVSLPAGVSTCFKYSNILLDPSADGTYSLLSESNRNTYFIRPRLIIFIWEQLRDIQMTILIVFIDS